MADKNRMPHDTQKKIMGHILKTPKKRLLRGKNPARGGAFRSQPSWPYRDRRASFIALDQGGG